MIHPSRQAAPAPQCHDDVRLKRCIAIDSHCTMSFLAYFDDKICRRNFCMRNYQRLFRTSWHGFTNIWAIDFTKRDIPKENQPKQSHFPKRSSLIYTGWRYLGGSACGRVAAAGRHAILHLLQRPQPLTSRLERTNDVQNIRLRTRQRRGCTAGTNAGATPPLTAPCTPAFGACTDQGNQEQATE